MEYMYKQRRLDLLYIKETLPCLNLASLVFFKQANVDFVSKCLLNIAKKQRLQHQWNVLNTGNLHCFFYRTYFLRPVFERHFLNEAFSSLYSFIFHLLSKEILRKKKTADVALKCLLKTGSGKLKTY